MEVDLGQFRDWFSLPHVGVELYRSSNGEPRTRQLGLGTRRKIDPVIHGLLDHLTILRLLPVDRVKRPDLHQMAPMAVRHRRMVDGEIIALRALWVRGESVEQFRPTGVQVASEQAIDLHAALDGPFDDGNVAGRIRHAPAGFPAVAIVDVQFSVVAWHAVRDEGVDAAFEAVAKGDEKRLVHRESVLEPEIVTGPQELAGRIAAGCSGGGLLGLFLQVFEIEEGAVRHAGAEFAARPVKHPLMGEIHIHEAHQGLPQLGVVGRKMQTIDGLHIHVPGGKAVARLGGPWSVVVDHGPFRTSG